MKKQILKNGVRVLTVPMKGTQTFTFLVMVATGSRNEVAQNSGISHFLEHMFFKGTKKRPNTLDISSALDKVGGEFNAFTGKEYTGYYAKVDGSHAAIAIDVISDMLLNSTFDSKEINREKGVILEEVNMYTNNPMIHIEDLFEENLYGDTPLGWNTIGTKENIKSFKRKNFIDYQKSQYRGKNIIVCLAGKYSSKDLATVKKLANQFPVGESEIAIKNEAKQTVPQIKIKKQKTEQINLSVGVRAYNYNHKDYFTSKLLAVILGGSMSSRLFISVRERQGLAYQVRTQIEGYRDEGYLTTTIGTSASTAIAAVKAVMKEYEKIKRVVVGNVELDKAKDYIRGKLILGLESSDDLASWYAKQEVLNFAKIRDPKDVSGLLDMIKSSDIKRVASNIFINENLNLAAIGHNINEKDLKKTLKLTK